MKKKKTKSSIPRKHRMEEPVWRAEAPKKTSSKLYYFDKRYYFNLRAHRWKKHIDGDWDNGPIITKIPLDSEQAVLSCCSASEEGVRFKMVAGECVLYAVVGMNVCEHGPFGKQDYCEEGGSTINWSGVYSSS